MKTKRIGAQIVEAMREAVAIHQGRAVPAARRVVTLDARTSVAETLPVYDRVTIARLRAKLALSQPVFASALNVSPETVRAWEQGKRVPDGAAVRLLQVAEEHPAWLRGKVQPARVKRRA